MINPLIQELISNKDASVIRKMFEEGIEMKKIYGADKVYDFSLGNPDLDPPQKVVDAVKEVAQDTSHGRHGYMPNAGYPETRAAMARKVSLEQGVKLESGDVVITAGAASALNCVFKTILNAGDNVIVPKPFFAEYRNYVRNYGGILQEVSTKDDFSLDVESIKKALNEKTAAVLINSPNNPTGKVYTESDIIALAECLKEHAAKSGRTPYLILDEPYRAITYDGKTVPSAFDKYDSSIVVSSFAKNLSLPGERIGYIAVNPKAEDAKNLIGGSIFSLRVLGFVNAPAFFQKVVQKSWDAEVDFSSYEKRRNLLMGVLDKAGIEYYRPEGAFYLFVKVPAKFNGDDMAFSDHLKKFHILCAPGKGFGGPGWVRLAYCVDEKSIVNSQEAFIEAAK
ncbi:MAG TPA: pyridoxal phosphate-dependent aminotransferase [Treponema sp.]|nr:pyridoxal phosphate-dependent aminotransferase [Treponema sp.]